VCSTFTNLNCLWVWMIEPEKSGNEVWMTPTEQIVNFVWLTSTQQTANVDWIAVKKTQGLFIRTDEDRKEYIALHIWFYFYELAVKTGSIALHKFFCFFLFFWFAEKSMFYGFEFVFPDSPRKTNGTKFYWSIYLAIMNRYLPNFQKLVY